MTIQTTAPGYTDPAPDEVRASAEGTAEVARAFLEAFREEGIPAAEATARIRARADRGEPYMDALAGAMETAGSELR